jgi:hypothetical protein
MWLSQVADDLIGLAEQIEQRAVNGERELKVIASTVGILRGLAATYRAKEEAGLRALAEDLARMEEGDNAK